jgi:RNA-binding protein YlmH
LSHRDFLGALLSLNIKRETIGDILVGDSNAVVFVTNTVAPLILSEITKIGRVGVKVSDSVLDVLPIREEFEDIFGTVSSLRLDSVVSVMTGLSREKASEIILAKRVSLNHFECTSVSKTLKQADVISIRGYGRFILNEASGLTKKGRIKVNIKKYK